MYVFMYLHGHHHFHEIRLERGVAGTAREDGTARGRATGGGKREGGTM
jgi:hypothetical protein